MKKKRLDLALALTGAYMTREAGNGKSLPDFNREKLERTFTFERAEVDEDNRRVELSFSSEAEIERWFGYEVLSHSPGAMNAERLNDGGALLVNHDWDDQVGVIESVRIDADRKGRAVVRFGRSARADEIFQDVKDGIRRLVSVGYRVHEAKLTRTTDEADVYTVTNWEPYEISIVSVPADTTVGVGRSAEKPQDETPLPQTYNSPIHKQERNMNEKILRDASGNLVRAKVDENGAIVEVLEVLEKAGESERAALTRGADTERNRVRALTDLGERFKDPELAAKYIKDGGSPDDMQRSLLEKFEKRTSQPINDQSRGANIGMNDKEIRNFSLMRAVRALMPNATQKDRDAAKFEFECSEEAQRQYGKEAQGILIPADILNSRAFNAGGAADTPTGAITGSNIVATDLLAGSFIEMLRKRTTIMRLGTTMAGLVGNVDIPKQTGGATAYWLGEGEDAQEGTPTIGQIELSPKTVGAYTDITRRLMMQSTPDAEGIVWRDLNNAVAQAIDYAGYYGTGTANQPRGIKNYTGINAVDFAAANPTFGEVVDMESQIAADNADIESMAYVFNAMMRGHLKTTPKFGAGTESTIWEQGNTVNGYRTEVTNQVAAGDVFFGNFADLIIALWGGLDLTVDPYSLSKSGGTRIVVFQDVDFALRRVESICYGSATVTP